jgi:hypothetical protein
MMSHWLLASFSGWPWGAASEGSHRSAGKFYTHADKVVAKASATFAPGSLMTEMGQQQTFRNVRVAGIVLLLQHL